MANPYTAQLRSFTSNTSNARRGLIDLYKARRKGVSAHWKGADALYRGAAKIGDRDYDASIGALGGFEGQGQALIDQSGYAGRQDSGEDARRDPALAGIVRGGVDPYRGFLRAEKGATHGWYKGYRQAALTEDKTLKAGLVREQPLALSELEQGIIDVSSNLQTQAGAYNANQQMLAQQQSYMQQMLSFQGQMAGAAQGGGQVSGGVPRAGGTSAAEAWIIQRESSGDVNADNPRSTAFGLGQLLIDNRRKYAARLGVSPDTRDYNAQLQMMRMYIKDRYGTAQAAMAFWQSHGWY